MQIVLNSYSWCKTMHFYITDLSNCFSGFICKNFEMFGGKSTFCLITGFSCI